MPNLDKYKWFQKTVIAIACVFFGLMVLVTVLAYSRPSGTTGLDMAKVQKMRYDFTAVSAEKNHDPQNGAKDGSPAEGGPEEATRPWVNADLAGTADDFNISETSKPN